MTPGERITKCLSCRLPATHRCAIPGSGAPHVYLCRRHAQRHADLGHHVRLLTTTVSPAKRRPG
jgi:hypothetical protein